MQRALGWLFVFLAGCSSSPDEAKTPSSTRLDMATWCPADASGAGEHLGVLPVPKKVYEAGDPVSVSSIHGEGADDVEAAEVERIASLRGLGMGENGDLAVVLHAEQESQQLFERCGLEATEGGGAHVLAIAKDGSTAEIIAPDALGRFHALQTLQQLLVEGQDGTTVRPITVYDAPSQARRGVLEGFYGTPWDDADRVAFMEALADLKFNYYAYAPKADDKINKKWREPFEESDLQRVRDVVKAAAAQRIEVCWEIHMGVIPPNFTDAADHDAVIAKFKAIVGEGVSCVVLAFDDILKFLPEGDQDQFDTYPEAQAYFVKQVGETMRHEYPDVQLWLVPNEYWTGNGDTFTDLKVVGSEVPDYWEIGWTGREVISPTIEVSDADEIAGVLGRKPLLGDNYPVSDGADFAGEIYLGPLTGRAAGVAQRVNAALFNPMEQVWASLPALATAADWAWNPDSYEPEASCDRAAHFYATADEGASALRELADSLRSPRIEPSVAPAVQHELDTFWAAYPDGMGGEPEQSLRERFEAFAATPDGMKKVEPIIAEQLEPWSKKLGAYGEAGLLALDVLASQESTQVADLQARADALAAQQDARPCGDLMDAFLGRVLEEVGAKPASGTP